MFKKILVFSMTAVMMFSLCACGESDDEKETTKAEETTIAETKVDEAKDAEEKKESVDVSTAGWKMSVDGVEIHTKVSNTSVEMGYTSSSTSTFEKEAEEGNAYVLIKMNVEKDGATENIEWDKMVLTDSDGTTYNRIDDSWIDDLKWKRMSGTTLNFGTNEGWFAYELPEEKTESGLVLSYAFADETMEYEIN